MTDVVHELTVASDKKLELQQPQQVRTSWELFGLEHSQGWHPIVFPLIALAKEWGITINQVKEKFGGLRFYYSGAPSDIRGNIFDAAVDHAERAASRTCELCGDEGKLRNKSGWWMTLCHDCDRAREKKRAEESGKPIPNLDPHELRVIRYQLPEEMEAEFTGRAGILRKPPAQSTPSSVASPSGGLL